MSKIKNTNHFTIHGWMIVSLNLSGNELLLYAIIYGFSQDGNSEFKGSLNYLAEFTNSSRPTVIKCLKSLVDKSFLIKTDRFINGQNLPTYKVNISILTSSKETLLPCKETLLPCKETLLPCKETLPHNNNYNNNYNNKSKDLFVSISNFQEYLKKSDLNKTYLFIAYKYWELWWSDNQTKTLKDATVMNWYDNIRLIVETDKQSIDRLIVVYHYFKKCRDKEAGFDTFWFDTIKSIGAFRKKDKDGVYRLDQIVDRINKKIETDYAFSQFIQNEVHKFHQYESRKFY